MASLTITNIEPELEERLLDRAVVNDRSIEEEARVILTAAVASDPAPPTDLAAFIADLVRPLGGIELEIPPRELVPEPPSLTPMIDHSIEEEVRVVMREAVASEPGSSLNLAESIARRMARVGGGVDLETPPRAPTRKPPKL